MLSSGDGTIYKSLVELNYDTVSVCGAVKLAPEAFSLYLYYFAYALCLRIQISYDGHVVVWI